MSIPTTAKNICARDECGHPKAIHNEITLACHAVILTNPWEDALGQTNWDKLDCPCIAFIEPEDDSTT